MTKWRTLVLATIGFNFSFLIWFSFAPFTGPMAEEFGLSLAEIGILASAAIWLAPFGRILTGWLSDRWGAPTVFAIVLTYVGIFSIASAFAQSYAVFFVERLIVATAGITFVIGIQHVSEWFDEEQLGTAEGIYAGVGNAGAAGGALILPRVFTENWSGPIFETSWRAAFFYTGIVSIPGSDRLLHDRRGRQERRETRGDQVDCEPQRLALHRHPLRNGRASRWRT